MYPLIIVSPLITKKLWLGYKDMWMNSFEWSKHIKNYFCFLKFLPPIKRLRWALFFPSWNTLGFSSYLILEITESFVLSRYASWTLFPLEDLLWSNLMTNCFHAYLQKISDSLFYLRPSNPRRFYSFSTSQSLLLVVETIFT